MPARHACLWSFQRPSRPRASAVGASAVKASAWPCVLALGSALAVAFVLPLYCLEISVLVSPQVNPVARKATSGAQRSPGVKRSGRKEAGARKCEQRSSASKSGRRPPASLLPAQGGQRLVPLRLVPTEESCPSGRAMCTRKDHMRHAAQENVLARKCATCCGRPPQTRCGHASGERVPG